jgi:hypothetical protein
MGVNVWVLPCGLGGLGHNVWVLPCGLGVPGHKVCVLPRGLGGLVDLKSKASRALDGLAIVLGLGGVGGVT